MNEDILRAYKNYLREKYERKNTKHSYFLGISQFNKDIKIPLNAVTLNDLILWKEKLFETNTKNTVRTYCISANMFFKWYNKPDLKLSVPNRELVPKQVFSVEEKNRFLESAREDPLHNLVALLLYDSIMRPDEIINIKIGNIDFENQMIYFDKTKVNKNISALMSPGLAKAILEYLKVRPKPKNKCDNDFLIIQESGWRTGYPLKTTYSIRTITRKIAIKAGIKRHVTPYKTIKPSALTLRFNDNVNPRILQRIARHRDIKTTLLYDHSTDQDALKYLQRQKPDIDYSLLEPKQKAQILMDELFKGEIDKETFNAGIELLKPELTNKNRWGEMGYV